MPQAQQPGRHGRRRDLSVERVRKAHHAGDELGVGLSVNALGIEGIVIAEPGPHMGTAADRQRVHERVLGPVRGRDRAGISGREAVKPVQQLFDRGRRPYPAFPKEQCHGHGIRKLHAAQTVFEVPKRTRMEDFERRDHAERDVRLEQLDRVLAQQQLIDVVAAHHDVMMAHQE